MSVAMELCRFAYLTCQHRELLRTRSPWVREDRACFAGRGTSTSRPPGARMPCPASSPCYPQSLRPRVEHGGTSPCDGLVCCSSQCGEVWKRTGTVRSGGGAGLEAAVGVSIICIPQPTPACFRMFGSP